MEAPPWQPSQTGRPGHQQQQQHQQQPSALVVGLSSPRAVVPTLLSALKRPRNGASSQGLDLVPCKARGMPPDHYSKTAYFAIDPSKIQHGDELVCSYPLCSAKIKFRWCYFCGIPVAKRNFRGRHGHSGETMDATTEDQPMQRTKTSTTPVPGNQERAGATTASAKSTGAPSNVSVSQSLLVHKDEFPPEVIKVTTLAQRARWAYLLGTRPPTSRSAEMVSWMTQVLSVSDEHKKNDTLPRQRVDEAAKEEPASRKDCNTADHDAKKPAVTLAGSSAVASTSDALGTATNGTRTESSFTEDPSSTSSTMMDDEVRRAGSLSDSRKKIVSAAILRNPRRMDDKGQEPNASSSGPSGCDVDSSGSDSSPSDDSQKPSGSSSSSSSNDEPQKRSLSNRSEVGTSTTADIIEKTLRDLRRRTQRDEDRAQDASSNSSSSGSDEDSRGNYCSSSLHGSEEYSGSNSSSSTTRKGGERQEGVIKTRPTDSSGESSSSGTNSDDSESRSAGRKRPRGGRRYEQERTPRRNKKDRKSSPVAETSSSFSESDDYSSSTDSEGGS